MAAKIRKNDTVFIISGKDRGKQGKVSRVIPQEGRVVVEGVNIIKRHQRARGAVQQAGIIAEEAPIYLSKVMLVCSKCERGVRVGFRFLEDGSKVRECKRCHEVLN